jgi:hypothetical protein
VLWPTAGPSLSIIPVNGPAKDARNEARASSESHFSLGQNESDCRIVLNSNGVLTYMSIDDEIRRLERNRKLFCLESSLTGEETARTLWLSKEVQEAVTPPPIGAQDDRLYEFRQFLDAWLEHGEFSVAEDPDMKPEYAMLARVKPLADEFWDFRVTAPKPGIRAFGGFAGFNTFVVVTWQYREDICNFDAEVEQCMQEWRKLFGVVVPFKKRRLDEYLSNFTAV